MAGRRYFVEGSSDFLKSYESLGSESQLKRSIDLAIDELKLDPTKGDRIKRDLWPRKYIQKYEINNLFRYPLSNGYRLLYTIVGRSDDIVSVILDALDHTGYDRWFGYNTS